MARATPLRRLLPEPGTTTPQEAIRGLRLGERAPPERPYVVANMIASADGKASFQGRSGPLGDEVDRAIFHLLRTQVDAVLVGSGTLRAERYGRLVRDPAAREARRAEGLAPDPLACVATRSLELPADLRLFQDPEQPALIVTSSDRELEGLGPGVELLRVAPEELTMSGVLRHLHEQRGVRSVLTEGGPTVLGTLLVEGAVDELFLTVAPRIAGGAEAPTAVQGPPLPSLLELELAWVLEAAGSLYLRYRIETA